MERRRSVSRINGLQESVTPAPMIAIINPITPLTEPAIIHLRLGAPWPANDTEGIHFRVALASSVSKQADRSSGFPLCVSFVSPRIERSSLRSGLCRHRRHHATPAIDITVWLTILSHGVRAEDEQYRNRRTRDILSYTSLYACRQRVTHDTRNTYVQISPYCSTERKRE